MFGRRENLVGLDIGSHTVKVVQVSTASTPMSLLNVGLASVPPEAFVEGRVSKAELVARSVQQLVSHLKIKDKSVASSISGYEVMIKKIEMPTMSEDELTNRMQIELGQYIPYNIEEVDVDYQILDVAKDRPNFMDVLLVAAKKESVADHVGLIKMAGLDPVIIDVDYFALGNAFEATYGLKDNETVALLDIGASKAIMSILSRGVPIFTRGISMGGYQITDRIRDRFKLSQEEAEQAKLSDGSTELPKKELEEIVVSAVLKWVRELRRAIDFYYSNFPDNRIDKVFLSGGSCRIAGLDRVFRNDLDIEVEIFNPLARMEYDTKAFDPDYISYIGPQMAVALGLALRKAGEK